MDILSSDSVSEIIEVTFCYGYPSYIWMDNLVSYNAVCLCSGATVYLVYPDMRFLQPKAYPTVMRRLRRRYSIACWVLREYHHAGLFDWIQLSGSGDLVELCLNHVARVSLGSGQLLLSPRLLWKMWMSVWADIALHMESLMRTVFKDARIGSTKTPNRWGCLRSQCGQLVAGPWFLWSISPELRHVIKLTILLSLLKIFTRLRV